MRHKYPYIIVVFVLIASIYLVLFSNSSTPPSENQPATPSPTTAPIMSDFTASFLIFTNGTKRIFTSNMYHNLSPDVYIENPYPAIIHVKKPGIRWKDFFSTLPMGISSTCLTTGTGQSFCSQEDESASNPAKLRFILNGTENPNTLEEIIQAGDKLLITFGRLTDAQLQQQYDLISTSSPSDQKPQEE